MADDLVIRNSLKAALNPGFVNRAPVKEGDKSFGEILKESVNKVDNLEMEADKAIQDFTVGGSETIHETMIAVEKAEISFKLLMEVRNKLIEAYQEVMRMQI